MASEIQSAIDEVKDGLWHMDRNGRVRFFNSSFYSQFDIPLTDSTLADWLSLIHAADQKRFLASVSALKTSRKSRMVTRYRVRDRQGTHRWIEAVGVLTTEHDGEFIVGCHRDVTVQQELIRYFADLAFVDNETGLWNRRKWLSKVEAGATTHLVFSLGRIKSYERKCGKQLARLIVREAREILSKHVGGQFDLYRLATDLFVIVIPSHLNADKAVNLLNSLKHLNVYSKHFYMLLEAADINVGALDDVSLRRQAPYELLLKVVEYASRHKKAILYSKVQQSIEREFTISDELREAIRSQSINVYLQPIYSVNRQRIHSFEALARWHHPTLGIVGPSEFIAEAERQNLIWELGYLIFRKSCQFLSRWDKTHADPVSINVNVSVIQLLDNQFVGKLLRYCELYKIPPQRIMLEITETHLLDNHQETDSTLLKLFDNGFGLSLDDFGSGLSSLACIYSIPFKQVKLDKALIQNKRVLANSKGFLVYLAEYCSENNIELVAEGIEDQELYQLVTQQGIALVQGYHFHRPKPATYWMNQYAGNLMF